MVHPGYDWLVTPTHDWTKDEDGLPPAGAFAWFRYERLSDGQVLRTKGYSASKDEALAEVNAASSVGR